MKKNLVALLISIFAIACKSDKDEVANLLEFIPANSLYIIDTPNIENFLNQRDTIPFLRDYGTLLSPELAGQLQTLTRSINSNSSIISINSEGGHLNYLFISREHPGEILIDSVKNKSVETLTYEDFTIQKYVIEEITIYKAEKNGVFIAGSSRQQLEQILDVEHVGQAADELFVKAHSAIDRGKTSLILRDEALTDIISQSFGDISLPPHALAKWNVIDFDLTNNSFSLNGISTWNNTGKYLLDIFKNSGNHINEIAKVTPGDALGFYSFTYQDIDMLKNNLKRFNDSTEVLPGNHFLHYTGEAGVITLKNGRELPVFKASDPELARELLIPSREADEFRGITIFDLPQDWDAFSHLDPLMPEPEVSYYIWIENFIIFAENRTDLEAVISAYLNNLTLGRKEYYSNAMENLAAASSLLIVSNNGAKPSKTGGSVTPESLSYSIITLQFVVEDDFAHIHGAYGLPGSGSTSSAGQIATINLEAPLSNLPYLMNGPGGSVEVIVQDEKNTLYLFSSSGNLIWKKQIPHLITGEIQQVDNSKNGNLQYAFTTPYALHVIDRKGNPVKPFPLEFKDEITQPLAVFDYDNNRTYRFVLTQGNNVLMYDGKGKLVRGFDFDKLSSNIIQPPKHIRLNNKDYIIVPESSGKLNILSRQGKSRIEVKDNIEFSATPWFPHKNNFVSISSKGNLITVNENGNVASAPAGENGNIKLSSNSNLIVTIADNTLTIGDKVINLDYGLYTSPSIFNSGGKTFISITDTQAQRVYIFDEKANLFPGFPLYGNSDIRFLSDKTGSNIFSVQGDENEIILYQF